MESLNKSMVFSCLIKKEDNLFVAHCLEIDIVATASTLKGAQSDLYDLILAQVDYAFSNDNLENLYHPAPSCVWKEFYKCKTQTEDQMHLESYFQKKRTVKKFVPPQITAKTCLSSSVGYA